jgi:hypothetical protein
MAKALNMQSAVRKRLTVIIARSPLSTFPVLATTSSLPPRSQSSSTCGAWGEIVRAGRNDEISGNRNLLAEQLERASPSERGSIPTRGPKHVEQNESRRRFQ